MKNISGTKVGKSRMSKGIVTNTNMPNQDRKRVRKSSSMETSTEDFRVHINGIGIGAAMMTFIFIPLPIVWKVAIALLYLISATHVMKD